MIARLAIIATIAFALILPARATDRSRLNQAGTYEQTMTFCLHPAHGFPVEAHQIPAPTVAKPAGTENHAAAPTGKSMWVSADSSH